MPSPDTIPPAAIRGTLHTFLTAGIRQKVVVSSRPLCPPASKPSATMASTPASSHFHGKTAGRYHVSHLDARLLELGSPCLGISRRCKHDFYAFFLNDFHEVSISGYISGTLTPKGWSVAALHLRMCSRRVPGCMEPAPNNPNPTCVAHG